MIGQQSGGSLFADAFDAWDSIAGIAAQCQIVGDLSGRQSQLCFWIHKATTGPRVKDATTAVQCQQVFVAAADHQCRASIDETGQYVIGFPVLNSERRDASDPDGFFSQRSLLDQVRIMRRSVGFVLWQQL